jgi:outer membrane protein assembly factor BamD
MRRAALALALAVPLLACGTRHVSFTGKVNYGKTAEENYQAGVDELEASNWAEANKFLEYVKTKYPFSKYAALAELRLADVKFKQDRYAEAAEAYKAFVQLHPTNEEVDYAEYRAGLSRYREAPEDFIFFPPAFEKDQRSLHQAVTELRDFVQTRPDSKYAPEAKKLLETSLARLAEHEWYVAWFYYKRQRWTGAAGRLETLVQKYPGTKHDVDALMMLAHAYLKMDEKYRAQKALQQLIVKYPDSPRRPEAEKLLASLR